MVGLEMNDTFTIVDGKGKLNLFRRCKKYSAYEALL